MLIKRLNLVVETSFKVIKTRVNQKFRRICSLNSSRDYVQWPFLSSATLNYILEKRIKKIFVTF